MRVHDYARASNNNISIYEIRREFRHIVRHVRDVVTRIVGRTTRYYVQCGRA